MAHGRRLLESGAGARLESGRRLLLEGGDAVRVVAAGAWSFSATVALTWERPAVAAGWEAPAADIHWSEP